MSSKFTRHICGRAFDEMNQKSRMKGVLFQITWMTDNLRASLQTKRETNEEFKKRFERNNKNKTEGPKAKIGHNQGSISAIMWAKRLV